MNLEQMQARIDYLESALANRVEEIDALIGVAVMASALDSALFNSLSRGLFTPNQVMAHEDLQEALASYDEVEAERLALVSASIL